MVGEPHEEQAHRKGERSHVFRDWMWKKFQEVFNVLPFAAVVDEKIFCIHAGLSPDLNHPDQIKRIMRPTDVPDAGNFVQCCDFTASGSILVNTPHTENVAMYPHNEDSSHRRHFSRWMCT